MSDALARVDSAEAAPIIPDDKIALLRDTICRGATEDEFAMFCTVANKLRLDPFSRQIHAVKRWDKRAGREIMSIQVSIDGFRLQAQRSGAYAGQVGPFWCGDDGAWRDVWLDQKPPAAAKVGALRAGCSEPFWGVALYRSYEQRGKDGPTPLWAKMPEVMIAKCAEALALRKAFPAELSGVYAPEEMAQAEAPAPAPRKAAQQLPAATDRKSEPPAAPTSPADYVIRAGKNAGKRLGDLSDDAVAWYAENSKDDALKAAAELELERRIEVQLRANAERESRLVEQARDLAQAADPAAEYIDTDGVVHQQEASP